MTRANAIIVTVVGVALTAVVWAGMMLMIGEIRFLPDNNLSLLEWLIGLIFCLGGPALALWGAWGWRKSLAARRGVE